jgi:hypothetical protein
MAIPKSLRSKLFITRFENLQTIQNYHKKKFVLKYNPKAVNPDETLDKLNKLIILKVRYQRVYRK